VRPDAEAAGQTDLDRGRSAARRSDWIETFEALTAADPGNSGPPEAIEQPFTRIGQRVVQIERGEAQQRGLRRSRASRSARRRSQRGSRRSLPLDIHEGVVL
jgi:hypothetical protein